ncbi:MAG TPA: pitrilysin family protein, partial [Cryomorphaceae bacterium]|nr:pitrilysin family protein [Cryomorphaceae bacterium]
APVYQIEGGTQDIVKVDVVFPAGTRFENNGMEASTVVNMLKEGTENYSSQEISETLDFFGAHIGSDISKDRSEVSLVTLNKHLPNTIDIFTDVLTKPIFPERELAIYKRRAKSALKINLEKVQFMCRVLFGELMFPNSPYRDKMHPSLYETITPDVLTAFYRKYYAIDGAYVVVSGKNTHLATEALKKALTPKIGDFATPDLSIDTWHFKRIEERKEREGAVQTAIRMGAPAMRRSNPNFPVFYFANMALGGYFGSRLMQNIREDKGYTYGIGSAINLLEGAAYIHIATEVGAEVTNATIAEIKSELNRLGTEEMPLDELELVKQYITGTLLHSFDGPFATSNRLKILVNSNLPKHYFSDFSRRINAISQVDVMEISREWFNPDNFSLTAVGKW